MSPEELRQDADFVSANPADQQRYLMSIDPDFAKASSEDKAAYLEHVRSGAKDSAQPDSGQQPSLWERAKSESKAIYEHPGQALIGAAKEIPTLIRAGMPGAEDETIRPPEGTPDTGKMKEPEWLKRTFDYWSPKVEKTMSPQNEPQRGGADVANIAATAEMIPAAYQTLRGLPSMVRSLSSPAAALKMIPVAADVNPAAASGEALAEVPKMRWKTPTFESTPIPESEALQTVHTPATKATPQAAALSTLPKMKPQGITIPESLADETMPLHQGEALRTAPAQTTPEAVKESRSVLPKMEPVAKRSVPQNAYDRVINEAMNAEGAREWTGENAQPIMDSLKKSGVNAELIGSVSKNKASANDLDIKVFGDRSGIREALEEHGFKYSHKTPHGEVWQNTKTGKAIDFWNENAKLSDSEQRALVYRVGQENARDMSPQGIERNMRLMKARNSELANFANENNVPHPEDREQWSTQDLSKTTKSKDLAPAKKALFDWIRQNMLHNDFMRASEAWGR